MADSDGAAAALGKPIELLQEKLDGRFGEDGAPKQELLRIGALNADSIIDEERQNTIKTSIKENNFHIFIVIETHITYKNCPSTLTLKGFRCEQKDRLYSKKLKKGHRKCKTTGVKTTFNDSPAGGILIYINDTIVYNVKSQGEYAESNAEFLHIEITSPVKLHLVALYSPNKVLVDHVISLMSYFMDPLGDRNIMFIGDTNIDKYGGGLGNAFFDVLSRKPYKVKQLINQITHGAACIDHIFTNMKAIESGVMENSISNHKSIYCTIAYNTTDPDQVHAPPQVPGFQVTNADSSNTNSMQTLMEELSNNCRSCILAIVCKFKCEVSPIEITYNGDRYFHSHCHNTEGMYYTSVDTVDGMDERIQLFQQAIHEVHKHLAIDVQESKKQCIIFTRNSQTNVFHALQKKMWYKDWGWDVVWQPRHVVYWDYVLEPSLTHAFLQSGFFLWNKLEEGEQKSIELEESSYRYWSEGGSISRLTFEQQDDT